MMGQHGQPLLPIYQVEPDAKKSTPQTKDVEVGRMKLFTYFAS